MTRSSSRRGKARAAATPPPEERQGGGESAAEKAKAGRAARLAGDRQAPEMWPADKAGLGSQRQGAGNVHATADAAVEQHGDPPFYRCHDGGQRLDARRS